MNSCRSKVSERFRMPCRHFGSRHQRGFESTTMFVRRGSTASSSCGRLEENSRRCRIQSYELTNVHRWATGGTQKLFSTTRHSDADWISQNTNQINSVWDLCWFILEQLFAVTSRYIWSVFPACVYPSFSLVCWFQTCKKKNKQTKTKKRKQMQVIIASSHKCFNKRVWKVQTDKRCVKLMRIKEFVWDSFISAHFKLKWTRTHTQNTIPVP